MKERKQPDAGEILEIICDILPDKVRIKDISNKINENVVNDRDKISNRKIGWMVKEFLKFKTKRGHGGAYKVVVDAERLKDLKKQYGIHGKKLQKTKTSTQHSPNTHQQSSPDIHPTFKKDELQKTKTSTQHSPNTHQQSSPDIHPTFKKDELQQTKNNVHPKNKSLRNTHAFSIDQGGKIIEKSMEAVKKATPSVREVLLKSEIITKPGGLKVRKDYFKKIPVLGTTGAEAEKEKTVEDKKTDKELEKAIIPADPEEREAKESLPYIILTLIGIGAIFFGVSAYQRS